MKTYTDIQSFQPVKNAVVTIGTFDGVHIGHQKIISTLKEEAKAIGGETVILTFFPHPRMILHPEDQQLKLITTIAEKSELLEELGIDHLIITPFTRDFSNLSPEDYVKEILVKKIGTKKIIIGYDHRFGKNREGGIAQLEALAKVYDFEVAVIPEQDVKEVAVSSTKIRQALLDGDIATANAFLGHPFSLNGKVIRGDQIGRTMGYPTANLFIEENFKLIPADGIYAVKVKVGTGSYQGMAYIGHRPTINGMSRNIEVNIFDFDADIYGQYIRMDFLHFIRGDQKFNSLEELSLQLGLDKVAALKLLNS
jgi:riboflavin kinase/FMN adenylyltransferase